MPDWSLPADVPLVLLPVRLETRFEGSTLLIRVFPDRIHIDSHEPTLTAAEVDAAKAYWRAYWTAPDGVAEAAAWDGLADVYGAERGAWMASVLHPTNHAQRPAGQPVFPNVTGSGSAWRRSAVARGLPTQWHVVGVPLDFAQLRARASGLTVANPLAVGPSPTFDAATIDDELPPLEPALRWLADFAAAEAAGMGLRLPKPAQLTAQQFRGWRWLYVYGVQHATASAAGAAELAAILDVHYYTDGLTYLAQGTPTNNTPGAAAAPGRGDPAYRAGYLPRLAPAPPADANSNARVLASALGLTVSGAIARAAGAADPEQVQARWMHTVTWAATWGYYLSQMLGTDITATQVGRVRRHVLDWVRPAGPLPTLRVANQPYGLLPVLATSSYQQREGADLGPDALGPPAVTLLQRLRTELWEPSTASVPSAADRQGPQTAVRILGMGAHAQRYYARSLLGMEYMAYLWRFSEPEIGLGAGWRTELSQAAAGLGQRLGLGAWDPRIGRAVFATDSFPVPGPAVQRPGSDTASSYLGWLGDPSRAATAVRDRVDSGTADATPVLYRLARHGLLVEHAIGAARVQQRAGVPVIREPELIDIVPNDVTPTVWRQLAQQRQWVAGGPTERLDAYMVRSAATDPLLADLADARAALRALAPLPVATLERLLAQSVDLASHRLDAWLTSFATRRLAWLRLPSGAPRAVGVHLGGYGWLEDVTPRGTPSAAPPVDDEAGPLWRDASSGGFVHAPSLAQATTAAVLRGGHRAYAEDGDSPFAIDLRSHRVQLASWLLDGVRQGQPLGALLGYRFERALREHPRVGLPAHLPAFRSRFPRRATSISAEEGTRPTIRSAEVVDGLALHRAWERGTLDLARDLGVTSADDRVAIGEILAALAETIDAVHDALLAEGVHHVVQGNPLRAGATLDAADRGEAPPPELDVARTPRTGVAVTHRLLVLLDQTAPALPGWTTDPTTQARAAAEPRLNGWLARLLPTPDRVHCRADVVGATGAAVRHIDVDLGGLGLSPLDLLYLPEHDAEAGRSELELRLEVAVRARADVGTAADVHLDLTAAPPGQLSVADLFELLRQARALLDAARPMTARDLAVPESAPDDPNADADLATRAQDAALALGRAAADLADPAATQTVRRGLLRAAHLGVAGALPDVTSPAEQAVVVATELARRITALAALDLARGRGELTQLAYDRARLQTVFGPAFVVLPAFTTPGEATLRTALAASATAQGGDRLAAAGWLHRAGAVRRGAGRFVTCLSSAEAVASGDGITISVAQLPYAAGERWLGLPQEAAIPGSRLSLLVHSPAGTPTIGARSAGLVVDEWVEVIPSDTETTGIAVHFDAPGACAPQAILVAVSPDARAVWGSQLVEDTLAEALSLARLRMVDLEALHPSDPDALTDIGQLLPASLLAMNVQPGDAIATDLTRGA